MKRLRFHLKEVIRENPELAQGKRRVVSEGQDGEKVDYIQVLGTTRTLVHSEQRKAQDRIIEVGVKPSISNSKGEEPAPVNEVPEYTGTLATVGDQVAPSVENLNLRVALML